MGLERIIEAISAEARSECERIAAEAAQQVERIRSDAAARAAEEEARLAAARADDAEQASAGLVNRARLAADRKVAAAREELFQEALRRLRVRLTEVVGDPGYADIFDALHCEAVAVVPDPDVTVLVRQADESRIANLVRVRSPAAEIRPVLECLGGLDIEAADGRAVRNTFDARLTAAERRLRRLATEVVPRLSASETGS